MFGSRATGHAKPDSDIDLFVEVDSDNGMRPLDRARAVHALFPNRLWGMDVVVYTSDEVRRFQDWKGTVLSAVREEGRILYERKAA